MRAKEANIDWRPPPEIRSGLLESRISKGLPPPVSLSASICVCSSLWWLWCAAAGFVVVDFVDVDVDVVSSVRDDVTDVDVVDIEEVGGVEVEDEVEVVDVVFFTLDEDVDVLVVEVVVMTIGVVEVVEELEVVEASDLEVVVVPGTMVALDVTAVVVVILFGHRAPTILFVKTIPSSVAELTSMP